MSTLTLTILSILLIFAFVSTFICVACVIVGGRAEKEMEERYNKFKENSNDN